MHYNKTTRANKTVTVYCVQGLYNNQTIIHVHGWVTHTSPSTNIPSNTHVHTYNIR